MFTPINPATGERGIGVPVADPAEIHARLDASEAAFRSWRSTTLGVRGAGLTRVAHHLRRRSSELARLMAIEMGKPVAAGRSEIEKCAAVCDYYAQHGERFLSPEPVATDAAESFVAFEPLGPVLAIMPWNFPFWQVFRFAAPALMAGNTGLLKHASNVPGCAAAIHDVFAAELPANVFQTLRVGSREVESVIGDRRVAAVTLTGSTEAGRAVAQAAGRALKKTVLELGGSDAYVILADADLPAAARTCAASRLINTGQSCIAAKRFVVVESVRTKFEDHLIAAMRNYVTGDPLDERTQVGPLARHDLREALHQQVQASIAAGARLRLGGMVPDGPGAYYPPTVLTEVRKGMPAFDEELFGPVAAVIGARDEAEAIALANDSPFGLGAAVFTRDRARGTAIARTQLAAGSCFVNDFVRSDPRLPFGGIKESGYGRELAAFGIREFVNVKTVYAKDVAPES